MAEHIEACKATEQVTGKPLALPEVTIAAIDQYQDEFTTKFPLNNEDRDELLDQLLQEFSKHEVPLGILRELMKLKDYELEFIIDDSGSMAGQSDVLFKDASQYVTSQRKPVQGKDDQGNVGEYVSRWNEAEDRLHLMIDMLKYIPTKGLRIKFLNSADEICLKQQNCTPDTFAQLAHQEIFNKFNRKVYQGTPILQRLQQAFDKRSHPFPTMVYLFTDGMPNENEPIPTIINCVVERDANYFPFTAISCTNQDGCTEWLKQLDSDKRTTKVAELDDYGDESKECFKKQGPTFPFRRGFWLVAHLIAAICPLLDKMDESEPYRKEELCELFGRVFNDQEYASYRQSHPSARLNTGFATNPYSFHQPQQSTHNGGMPAPLGTPAPFV